MFHIKDNTNISVQGINIVKPTLVHESICD